MGRKKDGKQTQVARTAVCAKCEKTVEVTRVMVVAHKTTWRDRCNTCDSYTN